MKIFACLSAMVLSATTSLSVLASGPPLRVCATIPDLGNIARTIGGDQVAVTVFVRGPQDPHYLEARPSFIKELSSADLFVLNGLDLEVGWAPQLWQNARNGRVLPGTRGFLDASTVVTPLETPRGLVDRSLGDVHPLGNPHHLVDPLNGLAAAGLIRDRLIELRPEGKAVFEKNHAAFRTKVLQALFGAELAGKYDPEKLLVLARHDKLAEFLTKQGEEKLLGGWLGKLAPYRGSAVIADHNVWPYFASRFGIRIAGFLEPKPGIAPSTSHLASIVKVMQTEKIQVILALPYFDKRHASFVAEKTGARIANLAHQCGARPGTEEYFDMVDYNVRELEAAFRGAKPEGKSP
jgi:ABC-type Zn uptake system ZnuABC Zn-binding protein ZnuA